jgi:hypothetical protein
LQLNHLNNTKKILHNKYINNYTIFLISGRFLLLRKSNDDTRQLMDMLMCTDMSVCVDDNLMGSTSIGPVLAGVTYSCSVTAINNNGTDTRNITDITPTQGIPSAPELLYTIIETGQVSFILRTSSPGDNETFQFIVNITNSITNMTTSQSFIISDYTSNTMYTATVLLNDGGSYVFTIITSNRFGQSSITITTPVLMIEPAPIIISTTAATPVMTATTSPNTSTTIPSDSTLPIIIGTSLVAGISVLIVTVLLLVIVVYYIIKRKKPPTTESTIIGQQFISVHNEAYGVVQSSTGVVTNIAYGCIQPSVPGEYEVAVNKPSEYEEINKLAEHKVTDKSSECDDYI